MRLTKNERRSIERLIKFRLAPFFKSLFVRKPLLVLVTANIWISSDAMARYLDGSATFAFEPIQAVDESQGDVKIYSRDDLNQSAPIPVEDVGDRLGGQMISILKGMGNSSSQSSILKTRTQNNKADYFMTQAVAAEYSTAETDPNSVKAQVQSEAQNVAIERAVDQLPLYQSLKSGFDFNLDFGKIFGSSPKKVEKSSKTRVRYGLILKSVDAKKDPSKAKAAINSDLRTDMAYMGEADVEWTIGPVEEVSERKVFNSSINLEQPYSDLELTEEEEMLGERVESSGTDSDFWASGGIPSAKFKSNVKPTSKNSLKNFISSKKDPGLTIKLTQEQGLYELTTITPDDKRKEVYTEHEFKMPIAGTMSIGRRYNDKFDVLATSAHNILIKKELPQVSVHYFEQNKQYVSDGVVGDGQSYQLTFKVKSDANGVSENKKKRIENQRGVELGVKKTF